MIKEHIQAFNFTPEASFFLAMTWDLIQFFDDVYDKDKPIDNCTVYGAVEYCFLNMPLSAFYQKHSIALAPALLLMIEKWKISNAMETLKQGDARSYMWRAAYYDVFALVCILEGKSPSDALMLYGEDFNEYLQEVNNA